MRILHTESSTVMGGQERRVLAESSGMRERGHDVSIATPAHGELARRALEAGLDVVPFAFGRSRLPIHAVRMASVVRRLGPDVVNSHSSADSWTAALARALGPFPGALVRSRHISAALKPGSLHRFLYGQADYVITTGEIVRAGLTESGLVSRERSASIPTGVDLERFRPRPDERAGARRELGLQPGVPVVGVVAYLRADKGHAVLLDAMPRILAAHPDAELVMVGEGAERASLEARAADLRIHGSVRFTGTREDVPTILSAFDVFCLPSLRNEGVPQSVLQAAAAGLPVVSTAVGGIPEAVLNGTTGFVVRSGSPEALAGPIAELCADAGLRRRLGEAGRRHVSESFSVQRMLDRTEAAYARALTLAAESRGADARGAPGG